MKTRFDRHQEEDVWSTSEAKEKFSAVINAAADRPQIILNRDTAVAVIISYPTYSSAIQALHRKSLAETMLAPREIATKENFELELPKRQNRSTDLY